MIKKNSCVGSWYYDVYVETNDVSVGHDVLNKIERCIQKNPQELVVLQEIFDTESGCFEKTQLSIVFIRLRQQEYVIPFLKNIATKPELSDDIFDQLYAATLLASINHPDGIQVLQELTEKQGQGVLGDFNIYNELETLILSKENKYIKEVIKTAACKYDDAREFYEYFYNEKIEA